MQPAEKVGVSIASDMLNEGREAVRSDEFASTSDTLRDALRAWQRQRREYAARRETIKTRIRCSLDDPRPDLAEDEVERRLAELHEQTVRSHRDAEA